VYAAIAHVHPVHDAIAYRRAALDDLPAHIVYVVTAPSATLMWVYPSSGSLTESGDCCAGGTVKA